MFNSLYGSKDAPMASKYQGADMFCFQCEQVRQASCRGLLGGKAEGRKMVGGPFCGPF